jgi:hypothetical protein
MLSIDALFLLSFIEMIFKSVSHNYYFDKVGSLQSMSADGFQGEYKNSLFISSEFVKT